MTPPLSRFWLRQMRHPRISPRWRGVLLDMCRKAWKARHRPWPPAPRSSCKHMHSPFAVSGAGTKDLRLLQLRALAADPSEDARECARADIEKEFPDAHS
jgi:hypothetical protein